MQPRLEAAAGTPPEKPNFVIIFADDLGYGDIGPFGSKLNRTPHLDRMAKEGVKLTSFYAAPVCTPSRAQMMSGCYAKRVSLPNVIFPACPIGLNTNEATLPRLLKQRGYATMAIGKWHLGDQPEFLPTRHGFDHYFGLPYSNDMGPAEEKAALQRAANRKVSVGRPGDLGVIRGRRPPLPLIRDGQVAETLSAQGQDALTARYAAEATKFIREHRSTPFFLYLAHTAVHVPLHPGAAFRGHSQNGMYGDWVEEVDWSVGQVLDTVRECNLSEKTLVIFTSDNGPWLVQGTNGGVAGPLRGGKGSTWEGGMREPTVAWWPGQIKAGSVCDAVMANFDLLPTFVSLAGGTPPAKERIDGRDLWPLLSGQSTQPAHEALYYFNGKRLEAVRSGPWKLALAGQGGLRTGRTGPSEARAETVRLYNLDQDIGESKDVAAQNPEVVKRLEAYVATMDADLGKEQTGPGVRPPGRVSDPKPMLLAGSSLAFESSAESTSRPPKLDGLKPGDWLGGEEAPNIAGKQLTISADLETTIPDGVIVAQGGKVTGYALYLRGGKLCFGVRQNKNLEEICAPNPPPQQFRAEARLQNGGKMSLLLDGKEVATGKAPGLFRVQPSEHFCIGFDDAEPVGSYSANTRFSGTIQNLKVTVTNE